LATEYLRLSIENLLTQRRKGAKTQRKKGFHQWWLLETVADDGVDGEEDCVVVL
jgi:hypothetical protein